MYYDYCFINQDGRLRIYAKYLQSMAAGHLKEPAKRYLKVSAYGVGIGGGVDANNRQETILNRL